MKPEDLDEFIDAVRELSASYSEKNPPPKEGPGWARGWFLEHGVEIYKPEVQRGIYGMVLFSHAAIRKISLEQLRMICLLLYQIEQARFQTAGKEQ